MICACGPCPAPTKAPPAPPQRATWSTTEGAALDRRQRRRKYASDSARAREQLAGGTDCARRRRVWVVGRGRRDNSFIEQGVQPATRGQPSDFVAKIRKADFPHSKRAGRAAPGRPATLCMRPQQMGHSACAASGRPATLCMRPKQTSHSACAARQIGRFGYAAPPRVSVGRLCGQSSANTRHTLAVRLAMSAEDGVSVG